MDITVAESRTLARTLVKTAEAAKHAFNRAAQSCGLPLHLARAVLLLEKPMPMRHIAAELACDPSHVTGIADQLARRGLAERVPGADRRTRLVQLTDSGEETRDRLAAQVAAGPMFGATLTAAQRQQLLELLEEVLAATPAAENPHLLTAD